MFYIFFSEEIRKRSQHDIFISYQWDNQKEVMNIRKSLDLAGFSCWMDIGQIGGGGIYISKSILYLGKFEIITQFFSRSPVQ